MDVSVVIPTRDREITLERCLRALLDQSYSKNDYEIVVVDDGSLDGTRGVVSRMKANPLCSLRYYRQERKGPAAARNLGIKNSVGEFALLLGDDILAERELIEQHVVRHAAHVGDSAVLGRITWSPEIRVTPFMRYIGQSGDQFGYGLIKDGQELPFNYFYSSNVSIKRNILLEEGLFDEAFTYAAFEDTELGLRIQRRGVRIVFSKGAVGYHLHPITVKGFCRRQFLAGISAATLIAKHPETRDAILGTLGSESRTKSAAKRMMIPVLALAADLLDRQGQELPERFYRRILDYYLLKGYRKGRSRQRGK